MTSGFGPDRPAMDATNGEKTLTGHNGMDFAAPKGTRVNAVMDGKVISVDTTGRFLLGKKCRNIAS